MEEDPIQVHCRIKPSPTAGLLRVDHSSGAVWADSTHSCRFHHVFGPEASQRHVFEQTALPLLESVCKGFNATLLAYGQTGSGKTHTICGDLVGDNQGIIPRVANYLLEQLDQNKLDQVQFSVLEVYLGELYDLSSRTQNVSKLTIRERPNGETFVQNLRTFSLVDFDDFVKRFQMASEIRKVASTRQNDRSTRSHLIATFRVQVSPVFQHSEGYHTPRLVC